ncbi:leucine--tRNA ligase, mitochondrial isoform X1 [Galleria mellonella]|uniref:leucine--tRNA ligase n=2 Tax=Galleria mellonella TaxID=7137 RepID=A0A6J1WTJ3_GALME|nr:leucine--tRNA ligase, mitochondrial isoform X1 [Galleria mellonella]
MSFIKRIRLGNCAASLPISSLSNRKLSSLGLWQQDICTEIKVKIEKHWSRTVLNNINKDSDKAYYILPMFPYPSGNLHMGHVRVYSISDTIARFHALNGEDVIHPIGWDAFGLPAENAAIERNIAPHKWTNANINSMKQQLLQLGLNFDWSREISTCEPQYYKWTQYIFLKLFEKGMVYQSKAKVNWDPVDKTVLADEQVDDSGHSWRSGAKVESKILTQWFIKTTKYAKKLYDGLNSEYLENWKDIINLQKHWIGECDGIVVSFTMKVGNKVKQFDVWTHEPYRFIHGKFLTMSKNNIIIQEIPIEDTGHLLCYNPITNTELPIYITDEVNYPIGRDVYIASPATNQDDLKLAKSLNISVSKSDKVIDFESDNHKVISIANNKNVGGYFVNSKLKDWLISRQRYWGTPIPIIHCDNCGAVPVPYTELPVKLPCIEFSEYGSQTLTKLNDWVNCKCPKCHSDAKRETDTMDTFVDSSWYYYRFLDPQNEIKPFDKEKLCNKVPVNIYIGGKEHAVLHLYYARFMSYFLHSLGWTPTEEPFKKLLVQGMVMGQSYKLKSSGKYLPPESVEKIGKEYKEKKSGEPVIVQWEKMSKSKYNGENPERLLSKYGCDTTRLLILADVPPATNRNWSDATLPGVLNWQHRLWITIRDFLNYRNNTSLENNLSDEEFMKLESKIWESKNYFIATSTYHFKHTQKLSVGISRLQGLTNTLRNNLPCELISKSQEFEKALACLIIMLAPVMPHFCSELWAGFLSAPNRKSATTNNVINWNKNVFEQKWPKVDDSYKLSFLCKVDGADRCDLKIRATELDNLSQEQALRMMLNQESVSNRIKNEISRTKYELYPGCRAILHIFTKKQQKKPKNETKELAANIQAN